MRERWMEGLFLGRDMESNEVFVALGDGRVVRSRAITPHPEGAQVTMSALKKIVTMPADVTGYIMNEDEPGPEIPPVETQRPDMTPTPDLVPRSVRITSDVLDRYGYTEGCPRCKALRSGEGAWRTNAHNVKCRARIEEAMKKDNEMSEGLKRAEERKNKWIADQCAEQDAHQS